MKLRLIGILLMALAVWECSTNRPLITRGGLTREDRRHYLVQNGYGMKPDIKQSFQEGLPMVGMSQEMINNLYGPADVVMEENTLWEYVDRKGQLITGFRFEDEIVVKIMGDPRGGLPVDNTEE